MSISNKLFPGMQPRSFYNYCRLITKMKYDWLANIDLCILFIHFRNTELKMIKKIPHPILQYWSSIRIGQVHDMSWFCPYNKFKFLFLWPKKKMSWSNHWGNCATFDRRKCTQLLHYGCNLISDFNPIQGRGQKCLRAPSLLNFDKNNHRMRL